MLSGGRAIFACAVRSCAVPHAAYHHQSRNYQVKTLLVAITQQPGRRWPPVLLHRRCMVLVSGLHTPHSAQETSDLLRSNGPAGFWARLLGASRIRRSCAQGLLELGSSAAGLHEHQPGLGQAGRKDWDLLQAKLASQPRQLLGHLQATLLSIAASVARPLHAPLACSRDARVRRLVLLKLSTPCRRNLDAMDCTLSSTCARAGFSWQFRRRPAHCMAAACLA